MVSIVGTPQVGSGDGTITLANGSTSGRAVVVAARQSRNPANIQNFTIDGVSGNALGLQTTSSGVERTLLVVWEDNDLPAASGSYTLARNTSVAGGTDWVYFEVSGAPTLAEMEVISDQLLDGSYTSPVTASFANSAAGSVAVLSVGVTGSTGFTGLSGQTDHILNSDTYVASKPDSSGSIGVETNSTPELVYSSLQIPDNTGVTGDGSHQAATATHSASGDVGTLQVSLDLVDVSNTAAPDNTGITAVVYDAAGGTEIHETATASITSGTMVISLPSGTTANNGDEVFVKLHKAGASFNDDLNGAGRATVTIA